MVYSIREALEQDEKHDLEQKERGVAIQELRERLGAQAQDLGGLHRQMDGLSSSPESSGPPGGSEVPVVSGNPGAVLLKRFRLSSFNLVGERWSKTRKTWMN